MGLLSNISKNPMQILNKLVANDPQLAQRFRVVQELTKGNANTAKQLVIKEFQAGNINQNQFNELRRVASKMGISDDIFSELKQFIK